MKTDKEPFTFPKTLPVLDFYEIFAFYFLNKNSNFYVSQFKEILHFSSFKKFHDISSFPSKSKSLRSQLLLLANL